MNYDSLFEIRKFKNAPVFFTDRKKISDFASTIKKLPKNSRIIIREYDLNKEEREIFAKKIAEIARRNKHKVLVGKDFALARKIKADGVHFSDFDKMPLFFLRQNAFAKKFIFSFACHSESSLLKAPRADMIFLSPIFATTSHAQAKTITVNNLAKIVVKSKRPDYLYALGGINQANLKLIRKLGISGFGAIDFFK